MTSAAAAPSTRSGDGPVNPPHRVLLASLIGTTIEFYDFYVYAVAAVLIFPSLFFPSEDPTVAILSFAVFGAAMAARPLGGEWSGAALVATENAPAGKRAWYGTFPQLGAPLGFIIANGLFIAINTLLPNTDPSTPGQVSAAFLEWGWRIPFLASAVMVIVGLWVRLRLVEARTFTNAAAAGRLVRLPLGTVLRSH